MNQTQGNKDPKFSFWQLLVGFVLLEVAIVALSAFGSGCASVDQNAAYNIYTNIVVRIPDSPAQGAKVDGAPGSGSAGESASSSATDAKGDSGKGKSPEPSSPSVALDFKYGGFKGGGAKEDSRCQISGLKVGTSGLSFKWLSDIPSDWKRQKDEKGSWVIAAVFVKDSKGRWIGGKFDLIDRSRSTRDFKNINSGYNGWDASVFRSAKKHAFCVVSADGRWRSNLIED